MRSDTAERDTYRSCKARVAPNNPSGITSMLEYVMELRLYEHRTHVRCHAVLVTQFACPLDLRRVASCDAGAMLATYSVRSTVVYSSRSAGSTVGLPSAMVVRNFSTNKPGVWWNRVFGSGELNDTCSASLNTATRASGTKTRPRPSRGVLAERQPR